MNLTVAFDNPGSLISPDNRAGVLRRSDTQAPLRIYLKEDATGSAAAQLYFIPVNVRSGAGTGLKGDFDLKFRLEDIPLSCQGSTTWVPQSVWVNGAPSLESLYPVGTAYRLGTGNGDFVEFVFRLRDFTIGNLGTSSYFDIMSSSLEFPCSWWTRIAVTFIEPYSIGSYKPAGVEPSMVDNYFRLTKFKWPDTFVDGGPLPQYIALESAPLGGETVNISGTNLVYAPSSASTDGNGVFGVVAFVDPAAFEKAARDKADPPKSGDLSFTYKEIIRKHKISGNFAEVIQVEGKVTIVFGSGESVKVGDILQPGTTLSLSARVGEPAAQLGLRFINGSDAQVIQDVFTNACITDLIVIGQTEFTNKSVIQGKSALMSLTRYLCEQAAGLPNTPEEWAKATGKFIVKQAVSTLVPVTMGYETTAFIVKYGVQKVTGEVYDYTFSSPGDNRNKSGAAGARSLAKATGDPRLELSTYYDGSTRIAESIAGAFGIYQAAASAPFASSADGVWQELTGPPAIVRTWNQTPDSIDTTGPVLRMSHEYSPLPYPSTAFRLTASDPSGLDAATLSVTIDGVAGNVASSFENRGGGVWVGEFLGPPPQAYRVHAALTDRVGNRSNLDWLGDRLPGAPRDATAAFNGGRAWVEWNPPDGMAAADILYFELREYWKASGVWTAGPWRSVGNVNRVTVDLPAGLVASAPFYYEVRAWNTQGVAGTAARTFELTAVETTARLDVARSGAGSGSVTGSGIACGSDCIGFYPFGTSVTLTATAASGSVFAGWTGACSGTGACTVTMDVARSVTADFAISTNPARLANLSTRGRVETGNDVMIGGFIIGGSTPKKVLITARGPSLTAFGVTGAMANPTLQLFSGQTVIASNDDWQTNANAADITATGIAPTNALESALLVTLSPGAYTAIVSGVGGGTGVGIVEVFEQDRPDIPLINISTRGQVQTGDNVMIGGFIIYGDAPKTVLITARGPSLAPFGITNPLANPSLQLFSGQTVIASNDDFGTAPNLVDIQATGVAPTDSRESAILVTLSPGAYTAIVTGVGGGTGVGIVEVFAQ